MVATSVTGRGLGSAEGSNKGRVEGSYGVERLLGPRVMAAGTVDTDGSGNATVILPLFDGAVTDYVVMATAMDSESAIRAYLTFGTNDTTITIAGPNSEAVAWTIIKVGLAI